VIPGHWVLLSDFAPADKEFRAACRFVALLIALNVIIAGLAPGDEL
jgi:hypothetical protein